MILKPITGFRVVKHDDHFSDNECTDDGLRKSIEFDGVGSEK